MKIKQWMKRPEKEYVNDREIDLRVANNEKKLQGKRRQINNWKDL